MSIPREHKKIMPGPYIMTNNYLFSGWGPKSEHFEVNAVDQESDQLIYKWSFGFFDRFVGENKHQRIFTTAGKKKVEVIVSDGVGSVSKVWNVEVV